MNPVIAPADPPRRPVAADLACAEPLAAGDLSQLRDSADRACALLRALSNPDRLLLLCQLATRGEQRVGELQQQLGIEQPSLSQQLGVLRALGLVGTRRAGKAIYYRLLSNEAEALMQLLHRLYCAAPNRAD